MVVLLLLGSALVAARGLLGAGHLSGGALLPAPDSVAHWWDTYLSTRHDLGTGSAVTAPAYLLPLAAAGTLLAGSAGLVVDVVVLGAVPLAAAGAYRCLVRLTSARRAAAWGAAAYGLAIAASGAPAQGRLGTLAAGVVLPWLVASAVRLADPSPDRRRRAAWRTTAWLALASAFAPLVWVLALAVTVAGLLLVAVARLRGVPAARGLVRTALVPVPGAAVLLVPWSALVWLDHGLSALVLEAGLDASASVGPLGPWEVLAGRGGGPGAAPAWLGLGVAAVATLALLRRSSRPRVLVAWLVAVTGLAATSLLGGLTVTPGEGEAATRVWVGLPLLVVQGAWITAAVLAAAGLRDELRGRSFGGRQLLGTLAVLAGLATPVAALGWWWWHGDGHVLDRHQVDDRPVYMREAAAADPADGTLVLRGSLAAGVEYELLRATPLVVGDDDVRPSVADESGFTGDVTALLTQPGRRVVTDLAAQGVRFVFAPAPVDASLSAVLDSAPGVAPASAVGSDDRAWRIEEGTLLPGPDPGILGVLRPLLLGLQGLALVAVGVLAAPGRRSR